MSQCRNPAALLPSLSVFSECFSNRGVQLRGVIGVLSCCVLLGGCAVTGGQSSSQIETQIVSISVERAAFTTAAQEVLIAPWQRPDDSSVFTRLISGDDDAPRLSLGDVAQLYAAELMETPSPFDAMLADAAANLDAAKKLNTSALELLDQEALSFDDVAQLEAAIKVLRENRQVLVSTARLIKRSGSQLDEARVDALRDAYKLTAKDLGRAADAIANQIDLARAHNALNYAQPTKLAPSFWR